MKATLSNYRQSPRKVRLLADLVRGKSVAFALAQLGAVPKRASLPLMKLIKSAVANARENNKVEGEALLIKEIAVDKGRVLKRHRPGARGRAYPFHKHSSHIRVVLDSLHHDA